MKPSSVLAKGLVYPSLVLLILLLTQSSVAQIRTPNFVVYAQHPALARQVASEAERFRKELAEQWLGHELPQWRQPCPITVEVQRHAGGETSFAFSPGPDGTSQPFDWRMKVFGSPERILDSVLPHEVTHTIFATHYGRPLPRWADEGACTTVEHEEERQKSHQMLLQFLHSNRGIPFNHMFAMKQYPRDILPLYAQGYSVTRYLIMQKGHRKFVDFVGDGMQHEVPGRAPQTWNAMVKKHYGYEDLSDLQVSWLRWVREGSPVIQRQDVASKQAQAPTTQVATNVSAGVNENAGASPAALAAQNTASAGSIVTLDQGSWYARQSRTGGNTSMQRPPATESATAEPVTDPAQYLPGSTQLDVPQPTPVAGKSLWR